MATSPIKCNAPTVTRVNDARYVFESVVLQGHGSFRRIRLRNSELPVGIPDDHVDVDVHYCGLNFTDNYVRLGIIRCQKFPMIMGSECAGLVLGVGSGVTDIKVGQRVLCLKMHGGLFSRFVRLPRSNCFVIPDTMKMIQAVCIGLDFLVAHLCLFEVGHMKDTDRLFVQSIAGGVGTAMVQLARAVLGDKVKIFGTAGEEKHDDVLFLGANRVFTHEGDYAKEIKQECLGGVDIAINSNGGTDITKLLQMVKPFGTLINIGSNSTAIYPKSLVRGMVRPSWDIKHMTPGEIIEGNRKISGFNIEDLMQAFPEKMEAIVEETFQLLCSRKIQTRVHKIVQFDEVINGLKELCTRENTGKVMMVLKHESYKHPKVPSPLPVPSGEPCQEKEDAASPHEVHTTHYPHCTDSSALDIPSENASHHREEAGSHDMGDGEECASLAEPVCGAEDAGRQRSECCVTEEDLAMESDLQEGEKAEEEEGEEKEDADQEREDEELEVGGEHGEEKVKDDSEGDSEQRVNESEGDEAGESVHEESYKEEEQGKAKDSEDGEQGEETDEVSEEVGEKIDEVSEEEVVDSDEVEEEEEEEEEDDDYDDLDATEL